jgi:prevent-host-death family protein
MNRASRKRASQPARASGEPARFTATRAKNEFGRVLEMALRGDAVIITKYEQPKAVLISVDEFTKLSRNAERSLDALRVEFDDLLAGMQSPKSRAAMKAAFGASSLQLGASARSAARKRA